MNKKIEKKMINEIRNILLNYLGDEDIADNCCKDILISLHNWQMVDSRQTQREQYKNKKRKYNSCKACKFNNKSVYICDDCHTSNEECVAPSRFVYSHINNNLNTTSINDGRVEEYKKRLNNKISIKGDDQNE